MDERLKFIVACAEESNFAEVCRRFLISRKTGYKWLERYKAEGVAGLRRRPPVVPEPPHRLSPELVDSIVAMRKQHPTWGPKKLLVVLAEAEPERDWPAASTVGDVLTRNGLIRPKRRRVRSAPGTSPLAPCEEPNDTWCVDFKGHFAMGNRVRCHPLTITDAATRYLLKCEGLLQPRVLPVREHFELAFKEFGMPRRIRSDNGPPFSTLSPGGLSALSVWWIKLGIVPERIAPGHPEQNGRHERMHRTLKEETASPPHAVLAQQQRAFDAFCHEYNSLRPHEALGQVPPARRYETSTRIYPAELPPMTYGDLKTRWTKRGRIKWRNQSVRISKLLRNEMVGLKQITEALWEVYFGPVLLGVLDDRDKVMELRTVDTPHPGSATLGPVLVSPGPVPGSLGPVLVSSGAVCEDSGSGLRNPSVQTAKPLDSDCTESVT